MAQIITGAAFIEWLGSLGIIQTNRTRRVVIDAAVDEAVIIYVEGFGDKRLISVGPPPGLETAIVITGEDDAGPD